MAKPGKERVARKRARKKAESEVASLVGDHWGSGGDRSDNVLIRQSLRWNTPATEEEYESLDEEEAKKLTAREIALKITIRNMCDNKPEVSNAAIRNLLAMEAQNQRDQIGEMPPPSRDADLNLLVNNLNLTLEKARDSATILAEFDESYAEEAAGHRPQSGRNGSGG